MPTGVGQWLEVRDGRCQGNSRSDQHMGRGVNAVGGRGHAGVTEAMNIELLGCKGGRGRRGEDRWAEGRDAGTTEAKVGAGARSGGG